MKLSERQQIFTLNVAWLIIEAYMRGFDITLGESYRTQSQVLLYFFGRTVERTSKGIELKKSKKLSKTLRSLHADRLAIDLNFFKNGNLTYRWEDIKPLGEYWESLHPDNVWGGDFNKDGKKNGFIDTPHFQMNK